MAEVVAPTISLSVKDEKTRLAMAEAKMHSEDAIDYIDPEIEKRVLRKCDLRVVPPTVVLFTLTFLERVNIGNARIEGLEKELHMKGTDYNVALLILFVSFILVEIPSNLIMKKVSPKVWLSFLLFGCGIMNMCQGFVQSYGALVGCRFLLGIFEAGCSPGTIYLISMYYRRAELPWRLSWWYLSGITAGAFGGLLAYAIAKMDGIAGYGGWRWIFILEGLFTAVMGIVMYFWLVDWPATATFLTEEERQVLCLRLNADKEEEAHMDTWNTKRVLGDWKIWVGTIMYLGIVNVNYSTNYFNPTLLKELGYTSAMAQIHSIPLYVVAGFFCLTTCWLSGRLGTRYPFLMFGVLFGSVGFIILLAQGSLSPGVKYMALFFITSAGYIVQPMCVSWLQNNVGGHWKRAFAAGCQIGWGNAGGLVASNIFITKEAPRYPVGYGVCLGLLLMTGVFATIMLFGVKRENAKRDRGERDWRLSLPDVDNLGDDHPSYRFIT